MNNNPEDNLEDKLGIDDDSTVIKITKEIILGIASEIPVLKYLASSYEKADVDARFSYLEKQIDYLIQKQSDLKIITVYDLLYKLLSDDKIIRDIPDLRKPDLCLKVMKDLNLRSEFGLEHDPFLSSDELESILTGEPGDLEINVKMVVHELGLQDWIYKTSALGQKYGYTGIGTKPKYFEETDALFQKWKPNEDGVSIIKHIKKIGADSVNMNEVATHLGWSLRRINPAISYLNTNGLIRKLNRAGGTNLLSWFINLSDEALFIE